MRAYLCQAKNAFNKEMCYKANAVFRLFRSLILLFPQVFLWKALYAGRDEVAGITLAQMLTYVVLSRFIGIASRVGGASDIENKMKTGDIGLDLLRPVNTRVLFISQNAGSTFASVLLDGLPVLLVSIAVLGGIQMPSSLLNFAFFLVSLLGALLINLSFEILLGTFAFWFLNVFFLQWMLSFFETVFSGAIVPLWFLPDWMKNIAMVLPFQAARFIPIEIYLGHYTTEEILKALGLQVIWIVGLYLLQDLLWKKGIKRIVVLGG